MKKYIIMSMVGVLMAAGLVALSGSVANATGGHHMKKYPYEVSECWTMAHSDGVEGTYEWPQTRGCDQAPACGETLEFQHDTYWIRDEKDEKYLAGLTHLNSPADDARLEPHGYYSVVKHGDECAPVVPPKPDPKHSGASTTSYKCGDDFSTVVNIWTDTDWVLVNNVWVLGTPVTQTQTVKIPATVEPCPKTPEPPVVVTVNKPPVVHIHTTVIKHSKPKVVTQTQAVPSVIDAGL